MSSDQTAILQGILTRFLQGDQRARGELIDHAYERLRRLAAVILNEDFPRLKSVPALMQTTEVANDAVLGLYQALHEARPATVRDFFRLAAQRIRWLLLDRAKAAGRLRDELAQLRPPEAERTGAGPSPLLEALYSRIEALPEAEREVVDLLYFHGLTQDEAAAVMGVTERSVRHYWVAARLKLLEQLKDRLPAGADPFAAADGP